MDILGIGPLEFLFIILLALIILGPKDMVKAGRSIGRFLRKLVTSSEWRTVQSATREFKNLPTTLMREAGIEEAQKTLGDLQKQVQGDFKDLGRQISAPIISPTSSDENPAEIPPEPLTRPNNDQMTEDKD